MLRENLLVCGAALLLIGGLGMLGAKWDENQPYQIAESEASQVRGGSCTRLDNVTNVCGSTCQSTGGMIKANPGVTGGQNPTDVKCEPKPDIVSCGGGQHWELLGDNACKPGGS
jgi:hypothetical protein